jgi:hypothetical protein
VLVSLLVLLHFSFPSPVLHNSSTATCTRLPNIRESSHIRRWVIRPAWATFTHVRTGPKDRPMPLFSRCIDRTRKFPPSPRQPSDQVSTNLRLKQCAVDQAAHNTASTCCGRLRRMAVRKLPVWRPHSEHLHWREGESRVFRPGHAASFFFRSSALSGSLVAAARRRTRRLPGSESEFKRSEGGF